MNKGTPVLPKTDPWSNGTEFKGLILHWVSLSTSSVTKSILLQLAISSQKRTIIIDFNVKKKGYDEYFLTS